MKAQSCLISLLVLASACTTPQSQTPKTQGAAHIGLSEDESTQNILGPASLDLKDIDSQAQKNHGLAKIDADFAAAHTGDALAKLDGGANYATDFLKIEYAQMHQENFDFPRASQNFSPPHSMRWLSALLAFRNALRKDDPAALVARYPALENTPAEGLGSVLNPYFQAVLKISPKTMPSTLAKHDDYFKRTAKGESTRAILLAQALELTKPNDAEGAWRKIALRFPVEYSELKKEIPNDLSLDERLSLAESWLAANRNMVVFDALDPIANAELSKEQQCRYAFTRGFAARKERLYEEAELHLKKVVDACPDVELQRRAFYLYAKVVSIRSGLRAIEAIEAFATRFEGHSMVDDVLFWAGDLYQRRNRDSEAAAYYQRAMTVEPKSDYCSEAGWRVGWMAWQRGEIDDATTTWKRLMEDTSCVTDPADRTRILFWLGEAALRQNKKDEAVNWWKKTALASPLSFYAQRAAQKIEPQSQSAYDSIKKTLTPPAENDSLKLCVDFLAQHEAFYAAVELHQQGLNRLAAEVLQSVSVPKGEVLSTAHAASLGMTAKNTAQRDGDLSQCSSAQARLLYTLMLDRVGEKRASHFRLRTEFAEVLRQVPTAQTIPIWRAAYPLAFRKVIEGAESEAKIDSYFLQALAREESAFDEAAVSWAGAYGLTQLLLSTAQGASKLLPDQPKISQGEQLLRAPLSARLGAAHLGDLHRRFGKHWALVLAAYNAGESTAHTWWKRHQGQKIETYAEELTIKETRGYVKRVIRTFGIYRWLYDNQGPVLQVPDVIPPAG